MMIPEISVVMSVYNAEKYLRAAIESILKQTFKNFEFIIIEDCSTDKSLEIIESYCAQDSRIKLLKKEKNKGTKGFIENLNWGLKEAQGKYIARMDADDISSLERLQKQFDFLEKNKDITIVGAQINIIDENSNIIGEKNAALNSTEIEKKMLKSIQLFHPVIMFRNENLKYREKIWYCEDYDLYLRLISENKKMANLPDKLLDYRLLNNSISRKDNKIIRRLFLEKAFLFHKERIREEDSYDNFNPDDFLKILDLYYASSLDDLKLAAKVCLKYNYKETLKTILVKKDFFYPKDTFVKYKILNSIPQPVFSILSKISNKLY